MEAFGPECIDGREGAEMRQQHFREQKVEIGKARNDLGVTFHAFEEVACSLQEFMPQYTCG